MTDAWTEAEHALQLWDDPAVSPGISGPEVANALRDLLAKRPVSDWRKEFYKFAGWPDESAKSPHDYACGCAECLGAAPTPNDRDKFVRALAKARKQADVRDETVADAILAEFEVKAR